MLIVDLAYRNEHMFKYYIRGGFVMKYTEVCAGIYLIGGSGYSHGNDCCVYLLDGGGKYALIDCGAGAGSGKILDCINKLVKDPHSVLYIILTHGHIDHIGGLKGLLRELPQAKTVAHRFELDAIELGDDKLTAAEWYNIDYSGVPVDLVLEKNNHVLEIGQMKLNCLYTPGHTPGGISPYLDWQGQRILFGQDIHGPFNQRFGSNLHHWKDSMEGLLALKADILCEGHFGVIHGKKAVEKFISGYVRQFAPV
jgi:glyoxylase-like metal-dependent hydrolase (beta-lactamase superfamily II)